MCPLLPLFTPLLISHTIVIYVLLSIPLSARFPSLSLSFSFSHTHTHTLSFLFPYLFLFVPNCTFSRTCLSWFISITRSRRLRDATAFRIKRISHSDHSFPFPIFSLVRRLQSPCQTKREDPRSLKKVRRESF